MKYNEIPEMNAEMPDGASVIFRGVTATNVFCSAKSVPINGVAYDFAFHLDPTQDFRVTETRTLYRTHGRGAPTDNARTLAPKVAAEIAGYLRSGFGPALRETAAAGALYAAEAAGERIEQEIKDLRDLAAAKAVALDHARLTLLAAREAYTEATS